MDTGHGTRSASPGSPQSQKEACLDLPATFFCFLPSWPTHPVPFPPKHCLPGVLKDGLALTTYSWLQPQLPHPSGPWSVLPPACPPTPYCGCCGTCPLLTEAVLTLRAATPGACHLHSNAWWVPGHPRLGLSLLASLLGSAMDWEVKGVISCLVPVITLMYYLAPQKQ